MVKSNFDSYRNIHVFSSCKEVDVDKLMQDWEQQQDNEKSGGEQRIMKFPKALDLIESDKGLKKIQPKKEKADMRIESKIEHKYIQNIEDIIMELSDEDIDSLLDDGDSSHSSPKNAMLEEFFMQRLSIK